MKKYILYSGKLIIVIGVVSIMVLLSLFSGCVPGATGTPFNAPYPGFPYIQSITAQVMTVSVPSPEATEFPATPSQSTSILPEAASPHADSRRFGYHDICRKYSISTL